MAGFEDLARAFHRRSAVVSARAIVACALERRETRGAHNRSDHLDLDPAFKVELTYSPGGEIARTPIADAPQAIVAQARDMPELGTARRLLG